jgi:hypothetical protein
MFSTAIDMKVLGLNRLMRHIDHLFELCKHAYIQDEVTANDVQRDTKYCWSSNTYLRIPITEGLHMASIIAHL